MQKETFENKIDILASLVAGDYKHFFEKYSNDFIVNADNAVINAHYVYDLCIDTSFSFFAAFIKQFFIDESFMDSFDDLIKTWDEKKDELDNEFRKMLSKYNQNIPIKEFPENTTDNEKEILIHLAKNYYISRELFQNKFPLFN